MHRYHNAIHAADVLQKFNVILFGGGMVPGYCDPLALMACYLSAVRPPTSFLGYIGEMHLSQPVFVPLFSYWILHACSMFWAYYRFLYHVLVCNRVHFMISSQLMQLKILLLCSSLAGSYSSLLAPTHGAR